jgi:NADPH-dependent 2,4-dienoyl-CoA reductase/sulfur reductase-like enzyme
MARPSAASVPVTDPLPNRSETASLAQQADIAPMTHRDAGENDCDVVVIGAGAGGMTAAAVAAMRGPPPRGQTGHLCAARCAAGGRDMD